jgi:hypothetical protein
MTPPFFVRTVAIFFRGLRRVNGGASGRGRRFPDDFPPRVPWRSFRKRARGRIGGWATLLVASLIAAPVMASTLHEGSYVRVGRSCQAPEAGEQLISNGHSVSRPGDICRVVSRTSTGSYYPVFNQRCTGSAGDYSVEVRVSSPSRIWANRTGRPAVAYRHCRAKRNPQ